MMRKKPNISSIALLNAICILILLTCALPPSPIGNREDVDASCTLISPQSDLIAGEELSFELKVVNPYYIDSVRVFFGDESSITILRMQLSDNYTYSLKHTYQRAGTFALFIKIFENNATTMDRGLSTISIIPAANFSIVTDTASWLVGAPIAMRIQVSNGAFIDSFQILYGDTSTATFPASALAADFSKNLTHAYNAPGVFPISAKFYRKNSAFAPNQVSLYTITIGGTATNVKPPITVHPQPVDATVGDTALFSITATGYPPPTYLWRKGSVIIEGATSSSLLIKPVTYNDTGSYWVMVKNSIDSVKSNSATLTVRSSNFAPEFTLQPQLKQVVPTGGTLTISVNATGNPAPVYIWKHDGATVDSGSNKIFLKSNASTSDAGKYWVIAKNALDFVSSSVCTVQVSSSNLAPAIGIEPKAADTIIIDSSKTFRVLASGIPTPTYQWRKNGNPIPNATADTFRINKVALTDSGTYSVDVMNSQDTVYSKNAVLLVNQLPVVTGSAPTSACENTVVTFSVLATAGSSPLTYQWKRNGVAMVGSGANTATYSPIIALADTNSKFICEVINRFGSIKSSNFSAVTVNRASIAPTGIIANPETVQKGSSGTLFISGGALGKNAKWYLYNGSSVNTKIDSTTGTTFTINPTITTIYAIRGEGECGIPTSTVSKMVAVIDTPTNISVVGGPSQATISWDDAPGAEDYMIYYCASTSATIDTLASTFAKINTNVVSPYIVTGLTNGTLYAFAIRAVTSTGSSKLSTIKTAKPQMLPPSAPSISTVTAEPAQVTVIWNSIAGNTYDLFYLESASGISIDTTQSATQKVRTIATGYVVGSLKNGTRYLFAIRAKNAGGMSPLSPVKEATPAEYVAGAPVVTLAPANAKVSVSWGAVPGASSYNVYYKLGNKSNFTKGNPAANTALFTYDVTSLTNCQEYTFGVCAVNTGGESNLSTLQSATPIYPLPTIPALGQPTPSKTKCQGDSVIFSVNAGTTSGPLTYVWMKAGAQVSTTALYTIPSVATSDAGSYTCNVYNSCNDFVTSSASVLNVTALPVAPSSVSASPAIVYEGNTLTSLAVNGGALNGSVWKWYTTQDCSGASVGSGSPLSISTTAATTYYVRAEGSCSPSAIKSVVVDYKEIPKITFPTQPTSVNTSVGSAVSFTVNATGSDPLYYQWQLNNVNVGLKTASPTLTFSSVSRSDIGDYSCIVTNGYGNGVTSAITTLIIPSYQITYNYQTGQPNSISTTFRGEALPVPTYTGCIFNGWVTDSVSIWSGSVIASSMELSDNSTLYARWVMRDADNIEYKTVRIGNQTWMAENLRSTRYWDRLLIEQATGAAWGINSTGALCWYNNTTSTDLIRTYGGLYNWYAIHKNIAPAGWHVPSDAEWAALSNGLGGDGVSGGHLKERGITHWLSQSSGTDNSTAFTALPGGMCSADGTFSVLGTAGLGWSSTENDGSTAWNISLNRYTDGFSRMVNNKNNGYSVRLIRD